MPAKFVVSRLCLAQFATQEHGESQRTYLRSRVVVG